TRRLDGFAYRNERLVRSHADLRGVGPFHRLHRIDVPAGLDGGREHDPTPFASTYVSWFDTRGPLHRVRRGGGGKRSSEQQDEENERLDGDLHGHGYPISGIAAPP